VSADQLRAHLEFFEELGVDGFRREAEWRARTAEPLEPGPNEPVEPMKHQPMEPLAPSKPVEPVRVFASQADALSALKAEIGPDCTRCKLHTLGRRQVVFGVGNPNADLMFVGRAGQLLTKIIEAIGMTRGDVYIANVIKCRPPQNRNPEPDEVEQCEPFLFRQIQTIKPKVIVALGKFAAQSLLKTTEPITRIRGREYKYRDAILMPTYHPAYLLRNPSSKREVWEDMKRVRAILTQGVDA
jgi:uracil-DNA glycosylase